MRPLRSVLYVPAINDRALGKVGSLPCDAVILDLEDAVAPEEKARARALAVNAIAGGFEGRTAVLRVNAAGTPWAEDDIKAAIAADPDAVLVPKIESAADVAAYHAALSGASDGLELWAMIETPRAVLNLPEIAARAAETRLAGLVVGLNDLALALRAKWTPGRPAFSAALQGTVLAARAHGLIALDAVFNDLEDAAGFEAECRQGRELGFDGKTVIHPRQIQPANAAFSPTRAEITWAQGVVAAFGDPANAGVGVLRIDGSMVERLHLQEAERILSLAEAEAQV